MTHVIWEKRDSIAYLTLNRPQSLNSLNLELAKELYEGLKKCDVDDGIRLVVLTGAGDHFMAGGDVKMFHQLASTPGAKPAEFGAIFDHVHGSIQLIRSLKKPVIAVLRGAVAGFGVSLAAAVDLSIADETAYFSMAYTHIGTTPDGGSTYFLPRILGLKKTLEMMLLNERLSAEEAKTIGLINKVVPTAQLEKTVDKYAQILAHGPTEVIGNVKKLLQKTFDHSLEEQLDLEAKTFVHSMAQPDFKEGVTAFVEKRWPQFQGVTGARSIKEEARKGNHG